MAIDLRRYADLVKTAQTVRVRGRVIELTGLVIKASVPNVKIGEVELRMVASPASTERSAQAIRVHGTTLLRQA